MAKIDKWSYGTHVEYSDVEIYLKATWSTYYIQLCEWQVIQYVRSNSTSIWWMWLLIRYGFQDNMDTESPNKSLSHTKDYIHPLKATIAVDQKAHSWWQMRKQSPIWLHPSSIPVMNIYHSFQRFTILQILAHMQMQRTLQHSQIKTKKKTKWIFLFYLVGWHQKTNL